jgi:hypothetical protein
MNPLRYGTARGPAPLLATCLALLGATVAPVAGQESDHLVVTDNPAEKTLVIALGPIDLPARTSHHDLEQLAVQEGTVPFDLMIRGFRIEAVDGDGNEVPQIVVHHANILDPERRELFLPIMRRVVAASHETKPQKLPGWLFGFPMVEGDRFLALTMLHNPTDRSYEDVMIRFVLDYERGSRSGLFPFYTMFSFHLDVMFPLGSKAFDLPPGEYSKSWEGSPAIPGGIIGMGGHAHQYATRLVLEDVTSGDVLYDMAPRTGEDGHIEEVPVVRYTQRGIAWPIYPDHVYRVTIHYYNPTGRTIPDGGMGSVAGAFIPAANAVWPMADPTDELFAADYANVLVSTQMSDMEGAGHQHMDGGPDAMPAAEPPPAADQPSAADGDEGQSEESGHADDGHTH